MKNSPQLVTCPVTENKQIAPGFFLLKFHAPVLARLVLPGQFFHLRVSNRLDIPLRRPFSVFDCRDSKISILYEIVGRGTLALSRKRAEDDLDVLGPLGNGFSLLPEVKTAVVIGGGMGIVPLHAWVKGLLRRENLEVRIFIGAKNKYRILCEKEFKELGLSPQVATDDGSYGYHGFITDLFKKESNTQHAIHTTIYSCGPNQMMRTLASYLNEHKIPGQLSLDRHMACGVGVCLGCVVKVKADNEQGFSYQRVCKDGPIFSSTAVLL